MKQEIGEREDKLRGLDSNLNRVRSRLEQELEIVAGLLKNVIQAYGNIESFGLIEIQLPEKYKENIRSFLATTYIDTDAYAN
jgi:hypothetical protein